MHRSSLLWAALLALVMCGGCFEVSPSHGGGQTNTPASRKPDPSDVALLPGYRIDVVATGLTYPTGVAFDDQNRAYVLEGGYCYGEDFRVPRLLRIDADGRMTSVYSVNEGVPWTGIDYADGALYIAEGGELTGGRIVRVDADGSATTLITSLPSRGDHHTNGPTIGADGSIYFAVGAATNSGVVGEDNAKFGWLKRAPEFHDIPAKDIKLAGENFKTGDGKTTGAYLPYGQSSQPGQVIRGQVPCTGGVMRIRRDGGQPQLVAWGLRNPFGLRVAPDGSLFVTENSYDERGSRPVWGCGDVVWRIDPKQPALWYGWPDFHGDEPLTWSDHYQPPGKPAPKFLLAQHPNPPPKPLAKLGVHSCAAGLDVSRSEAFGFAGAPFIALFGDMAPSVGKVLEPVGYRIVWIEPQTGVIHDFAVNRGKHNGPASRIGGGGFERPIAVRFDRSGEAMYVVDFGILRMDKDDPHPMPQTGCVWRITRAAAAAATAEVKQ